MSKVELLVCHQLGQFNPNIRSKLIESFGKRMFVIGADYMDKWNQQITMF